MLKCYLPADLEARLREHLAKAGIDAIDEKEKRSPLLQPSTPGGLAPADIALSRSRAQWSQAELGEKIGVSKMAISQWERGRKPIPKERMERLREILKPYLD